MQYVVKAKNSASSLKNEPVGTCNIHNVTIIIKPSKAGRRNKMEKMVIHAKVAKNRMYMELAGFFSDEEMAQVYDKFASELKKLSVHFDVITDISKFKPTTKEGAEEMGRTQKLAKDAGLARVIQITGEEVGKVQVARKEREAGIMAQEASSIEEADKILDGVN